MGAIYPLILLLFSTLYVTIQAIPTISVVGSKFFTSDGDQFFVQGNSKSFEILHLSD